MTTMLKMNRNRQINLPSAFVAKLSLGEDRYFKADLKGNHIILTPVDPVERIFSKESLDLVEEVYEAEKKLAKPVTPAWIKKAHHSA